MVKCVVIFDQVLILILGILPVLVCKSSTNKYGNREFKLNTPSKLLEDANLTTDQLIAKYKYPAEKHFVTTEDGYILAMHRIARQGAQPFLLMHGLLDSSAGYIIMGPHSSLGYYLWDQGYDVWMGNARGNRYSKNHTKLDPAKEPFWNFSFHEIGVYDLPAMIDYILHKSGYEKLFYVGHSQGTTVFFVMGAERPEYNEKIILMHAMAPSAYISHIKLPFSRPIIEGLFNSHTAKIFYEVLPKNNVFRYACIHETYIESFCIESVFQLMGRNYNDLNITMFPVILGHLPAGASIKQVQHYIQIIYSKSFQKYDYGRIENWQRYRRETPPSYSLPKLTAPVALHYSDNDKLCTPIDVEHTYRELGNVVGKFKVPIPEWTHLDFSVGIRARSVVYELIFNLSKPLKPYKKV